MAGRRAGVPNKPKRQLLALLQEKYPGYQPVMEMAKAALEISRHAKEEDDAMLWSQANQAHEKVAKYVTPQLKAVEVTGRDGGPLELSDVSDEDLEARAKQIAATLGISGDSA